jgi:16S rRNA (guanine527-N7)-methyltransferase
VSPEPGAGPPPVSRETLSAGAREQVRLLLEALAAEPDPHTSVSEPDEAMRVHVDDSLSGLEVPELRAARSIADIGAGAGFPGLVLAIALPRARVDLVESTGRKAALIGRLAQAAQIENARAVTARAEDWGAAAPALGGGAGVYDAVTVRAVAALPVLVEYAAPLLQQGGVLVAWKGARDAEEEAAGSRAAETLGLSPGEVFHVRPCAEARDRHLHVYRKIAPTPEGFPRRPGMAAKRPLGS